MRHQRHASAAIVGVSASAQSQPLAESDQASHDWSDSPRGHRGELVEGTGVVRLLPVPSSLQKSTFRSQKLVDGVNTAWTAAAGDRTPAWPRLPEEAQESAQVAVSCLLMSGS
jgi:hypothetical protein